MQLQKMQGTLTLFDNKHPEFMTLEHCLIRLQNHFAVIIETANFGAVVGTR